jgi:DNA-binding MarR family transcriptional regulator
MGAEFIRTFGRVVRALRARIDRQLQEHGLRIGQHQLLRALWEHDGLTPRELANEVGVEMPTVTRTVQRMVRDDFVRREAHPSDARSVRIFLTDRGRAMREVSERIFADVADAALRDLSPDERATFESLLERMLTQVKE